MGIPLDLDVGDWLSDPNLSMCSAATRGIWMDLICAMHKLERSGRITGTVKELAPLGRCSIDEMSLALDDLGRHSAADVTRTEDGTLTVINRRMFREFASRDASRTRQQRYRDAIVTRDVIELSPKSHTVAPPAQVEVLEEDTDGHAQDNGNVTSIAEAKGRKRAQKIALVSDEEFLAVLQAKDVYAGLNVQREFEKMTSWCEVNQKQPSRRRFINWLNRADQPMLGAQGSGNGGRETASERNVRNIREGFDALGQLQNADHRADSGEKPPRLLPAVPRR